MQAFRVWQQRTGHTILGRYGLSETVMLTANPFKADVRYEMQDEQRGGTVGFPLPSMALRMIDDAGKEVSNGLVEAS